MDTVDASILVERTYYGLVDELDQSVWTPRAVPLAEVVDRLREDGHQVSEPHQLLTWDGDSYPLAGLREGCWTDEVTVWAVTVDGEPLLAQTRHAWHGGVNSGQSYDRVDWIERDPR